MMVVLIMMVFMMMVLLRCGQPGLRGSQVAPKYVQTQRLEICQKIYTIQFSGERILHTVKAKSGLCGPQLAPIQNVTYKPTDDTVSYSVQCTVYYVYTVQCTL